MDACKWSHDWHEFWKGQCGITFEFTEGGPEDNGFSFCPKCGKRLEVEESTQEVDS